MLGYDAAGVVDAVGPEASLFKPGDEVFYAGSIVRPGTNAEFHLVDERIVGAKPKSLSFAQAAAMPLTSITAWEMLFDRLAVAPGNTPDGRALLIIGGAGGVGSMLIQLARRRTALTVIATASRPQTRDWCLKLGAHHVIDHSKPIPGPAQVHRTRARRADRRPDEHAGSPARHYRGDRAAGQVRAHRRSQGARH